MARSPHWLSARATIACCTAAILTSAACGWAAAGDEKRPTSELPEAASDEQIIAAVNELLRQGWHDFDVAPSPAAADGAWCRRVYLDLVGRIPTVAETTAFLGDRSRDKRRQLVERLLESDAYIEAYAANWTTIWTNVLIGRTGGLDRRSLVNRGGLQQYLRQSFLRNKPYDRMVTELIASNGCNTPGEENYNGAVNFLLNNLADNAVQATAKTSQIFLGLQVQCTQCHNHPFNDWKQKQFWGMNAFFRQTVALRTMEGRDIVSVRLEDQDFAGENDNPEEAVIFFEPRDATLEPVLRPTFVDGTAIDAVGFVDEVNRRDELARLMVGSEYFSRAIVNRMWAHFLGYGFTTPVDDMGPHNQPSHPRLLELLADQFAYNGYDLKKLMRWIALCDAYGLSSRSGSRNESDDPAAGEAPKFSRFYLRQMRAEELFNSLQAATQAAGTGSYEEQERLKETWLSQFNIAFGTDENDETTTFNGSIPQALMMMNGEMIRRATSLDDGTFLAEVASADMKTTDKLQQLYLAAFSRRATNQEQRAARGALAVHDGDETAALQDVWWALLNSNEFILNH